ncbi:cholinesterase [Capsaspora owczarzaki ATCC 30864]|uniref:Carboxylic ester hydrolase n=1 Tax=Capsaspora owczarzaki (strain ATCC 30864) TaxID=595528 RepID=A0A0D2WIR5_CAPO3|nr:cholinesterase [Capsaspora owczarzaki ATCC 30864]KJE89008.1 cholinesterase [Capsaspora owczarzaki ATCC 30864]|eukprot:XP_004365440.2 cholinesterase [Capsaspora owczarzaki ATCC 30864]
MTRRLALATVLLVAAASVSAMPAKLHTYQGEHLPFNQQRGSIARVTRFAEHNEYVQPTKDAAPGADESLVSTANGVISGVVSDTHRAFRGIPYGAPPSRFVDSTPAQPWSPSVLNAYNDPPGCPQICDLPPHTCPDTVSEDCLFLNVFTPRLNSSNGLPGPWPVMMFIHGGNFYQGTGGGPLYDGGFMTNTSSVVLVNINYRLGALGFYVGEDGTNVGGQFGFRDQRLALKWIRDNIAAFGGDPNSVTLFGQSAGAISTIAHMTSVRSAGLFHRAILESEPFTIPLKTVDEARKLGAHLAQALNCSSTSDIACIRSASLIDLLNAQNSAMSHIVNYDRILEVFLQWGPVIDNFELYRQPFDSIQQGEFAPIPIMLGDTAQEAVIFIYQAFTKPMSTLYYEGLIDAIFQLDGPKTIKQFPPIKGSEDQRPITALLATDYVFVCINRNVAAALSKSVPTYHFIFDHALSFNGWGPNYTFCANASCHGAELPYVFHSANLAGFQYTPQEDRMATSMVNYWTSFARYGDPNASGKESLIWPAFNATTQPTLRIETPNEVDYDLLGSTCAFFDSIGYKV